MPKISSTGEPSYAGHEGTVTNAVGEQFDVNPTVDLDGERKDGFTSQPVDEEFEPTPAPGVGGDITAIDEEDGSEVDNRDDDSDDDGKRRAADERRDNDQRPRLVDHRKSEDMPPAEGGKLSTAAKKAAPAATKK
jgi:hypothetical protein